MPITVRLPSGGGFSGGPFHSQNPESIFAHIPGLKCVCPATPADAKGLIIAAIEDPNPVLFFEHKHLYRRIKGEVPDERYSIPIGEARIHQEGDDITIVTWGAMVYTAEEAAAQIDDLSVEIVDLRTVMPWDKEAVLASVRKTSKVIVLHEDTHTGGFGAEIAATIAEEAFEDLDAPPKRIAAPDTPVPFAPVLEEAFLPQVVGRGRRAARGRRLLMATGTVVDVVMPQMGVSVSEGTITRWLKNVGDTIQADEPLLEISTDKVDTEVPEPRVRRSPGDPRSGGRDGARRDARRADRRRRRTGARLLPSRPQRPRSQSLRPSRLPRPSRSPPSRSPRRRARARAAARPRSQHLRRPQGPLRRPGTAPRRRSAIRSSRRSSPASPPSTASIPSTVPGTGRDGRVTKKDILAFVEAAASIKAE